MAEPLSLGQLGRVLLRYWILIVAGTLLGAVLAFGATRLMTPVYRATATQLVKGQPGTGSAPSYEAAQYAVSRAKTYPSFVYNAGVLESVQEDLGTSRTVEQLRGDLTASNPVGTPLLEITAAGTTPREASDKANSAAKHLALFITKIESVNGKSPISVELAVQAALPTAAASPKTLVITALGALVGFALATIAALLNSYVRYQRRSAFRRRQAMSWASGDSETRPTVKQHAELTRAAAPEAAVGATAAVDETPSVPLAAEAPPVEVPPVEQRPVEAPSEPAVEAVPENQPALVEEHDLETVSTVVLTKVSAEDVDRPAAVVEMPDSDILDDDLYPTIRIADLEGFLGLSDPDRRAPADFAFDTDRPPVDDGAAGRDGSDPDDASFDADRPEAEAVVAEADHPGPAVVPANGAHAMAEGPVDGAVAAAADHPGPHPASENGDRPVADPAVADDAPVDAEQAGPVDPADEVSRPDPDAEPDDLGPDEDATLVRPVEPALAEASDHDAPPNGAAPAPNGVAADVHTNGRAESVAREPVPR